VARDLLVAIQSMRIIRNALCQLRARWRERKWSSAGGLVLNARDELAIVLQRDSARRLRWTLPKGRIDPDESAATAALREVHEESGLRARIVRLLVIHEGRRHYTVFYEMALETDDGRFDRETKEVRFVAFAEAARLLRGERDRTVLRRLVETRTRVVG
jgi:ADP-ribose pyrophosphatase YjhB (NUDIX family)